MGISGSHIAAVMIAATFLGQSYALAEQPAARASLAAPLAVADFGSFFVGGRKIRSDFPGVPPSGPFQPGEITVDQMYVQYMMPATRTGPAIVLVHGFGLTGATFETTPDGREGWATHFVRRGHPTYVVDHPGRGRSGFDSTAINRAKATGDVADMPAIPSTTIEGAWQSFLFGRDYPQPYAGLAFPLGALDNFAKQFVPSAETTLDTKTAAADGIVALLDRIGPAVVVAHSQGGGIVTEAVKRRPALAASVISIEGDCALIAAPDAVPSLSQIPHLSVWGDNSVGAPGMNGDKRRDGCVRAMKLLEENGGKAEFVLLADHDMPGHTHMMMMDNGNLEIADFMLTWLEKAGIPQRADHLSKSR